jgi:hypothetical protein
MHPPGGSMATNRCDSVDLYWLPLGAGGRLVRWNGRVYERLAAHAARRRPQELYHTALEVHLHGDKYVIEMGPVWNLHQPARGVVVEGPVGVRSLGRLRTFRYEVRCWRNGAIPDVAEAVASPQRVSSDPQRAGQVLRLVHLIPPLTWGRDELRLGDMWNSNSLVAWLLARSGHVMEYLVPPTGGRAPGWVAGIALAARQAPTVSSWPSSSAPSRVRVASRPSAHRGGPIASRAPDQAGAALGLRG